MELKKLPMLQSLVPPEEMALVEAFPSILRLMLHGPFLNELRSADTAKLAGLQAVHMHRVIDNAPITIDSTQLWASFNYHLIHAIDFLPAASWQRTSGNYFFEIFISLHELLTRTGHLECKLGWQPEWMQPYMPGATPDDWRHWLVDMLPSAVILKLASSGIAKYSEGIGHSLDYKITWATPNGKL
jgi:hypothetical protein